LNVHGALSIAKRAELGRFRLTGCLHYPDDRNLSHPAATVNDSHATAKRHGHCSFLATNLEGVAMKLPAVATAIACACLAFSGFTLAQSTAASQPADSSAESTQPAQPTPAADEAKKDESAGSGSTAAPAKSDQSFTHGESKRCASLTGADKDQCDKEEATKTEGPAAQDASKPEEPATKQ
jgi:hypothetical protein